MVELEGPLTKYRRTDRWKQAVAETRTQIERRKDWPQKPLIAPPAARRRMALLWLINCEPEHSLHVGWMYQPPITEDMKWLVGRGLLTKKREHVFVRRRQTTLVVTEAGRSALTRASLPRQDCDWVKAAFWYNVLS